MTLSNKEMAAIFSMYEFCRTKIGGHRLQYCGHTPGYENAIVFKPSTQSMWCDWNEIEIESVPLSKITDEHAIEVAKLEGINNDTVQVDDNDLIYFIRKIIFQLDYDGVWKLVISNWKTYQQLILWHYAVPLYIGINHPANGKTPIELGIAIDATTVKDK